jgi:hypothetical protein
VQDLYATIDKIQQGHNPWFVVAFEYTGPKPPNPPSWMTKKYELCLQNLDLLLREQLSCVKFASHFDYVPYVQFNQKGIWVWSNLMSAL